MLFLILLHVTNIQSQTTIIIGVDSEFHCCKVQVNYQHQDLMIYLYFAVMKLWVDPKNYRCLTLYIGKRSRFFWTDRALFGWFLIGSIMIVTIMILQYNNSCYNNYWIGTNIRIDVVNCNNTCNSKIPGEVRSHSKVCVIYRDCWIVRTLL